MASVSGSSIFLNSKFQELLRRRFSHELVLSKNEKLSVCLADELPVNIAEFDASKILDISHLHTLFMDLLKDLEVQKDEWGRVHEMVEACLEMESRKLDSSAHTCKVAPGQTVSSHDILFGPMRRDGTRDRGTEENPLALLPDGYTLKFPDDQKSTNKETSLAMIRNHPSCIWALQQFDLLVNQVNRMKAVVGGIENYQKQYAVYLETMKVRYGGAAPPRPTEARSLSSAVEPSPGESVNRSWASKATKTP